MHRFRIVARSASLPPAERVTSCAFFMRGTWLVRMAGAVAPEQPRYWKVRWGLKPSRLGVFRMLG